MPTRSTPGIDPEIAARRLLSCPRRPERPKVASVSLVWEGTQFRHHSLAVVNREICSRLVARGHDLEARLYEDHQFDSGAMPRFAALERRFDRPTDRPARIRVRHQWPPSFAGCEEEIRVMIQPWEFGSVPRTWIEAMSAEVAELWVPSLYNRQCYVDGGLDPAKVRIIPNGVDLERFHPDVRPMALPGKKGTTFLFVGGTIPRKGVTLLLGAFARAFGRDDDVRLVIKDVGVRGVYEGSTMGPAIRELAARSMGPEILYLDRDMDQDELVSLYRAADVLVHPYLGEGFGMPILEAMACGLPVIVTGLGAALDFVNRDNGWLVPARRQDLKSRRVGDLELCDNAWLARPDPDALVAALRDCAARPRERDRRGRAGRALAESEFGWEQVVDMVEERLVALDARARDDRASQAIVVPAAAAPVAAIGAADLDEIRALRAAFAPAVAALAAGRFAEAETMFRALVASHPGLAAARSGLGRALLHAGRPEEAGTVLAEALEILPGDPATTADLAAAEIALGDCEGAERRLEALIAADDEELTGRLLLARLRRDAARIDEAAQLVADVLDRAPENLEALQLFALLARDLGYREGFDRARAKIGKLRPEAALPSW